jgi:S-adenosylmethionine:tRNA ribosyltransferase-isomerase
MKLEDFDFHVPEELVAQRPLEQRAASRMLVLHRKSGKTEHKKFKDLPEYLGASDILVFNKSKVIKARLIGQRATGGKVEIFLLKKLSSGRFECLIKATAAAKEGLEVTFGDLLRAKVICRLPEGISYEVELRIFAVMRMVSMLAATRRFSRRSLVPLPPRRQVFISLPKFSSR